MLEFEPSEQDCLFIVTTPGSRETWEARQETAKSPGISHPAVCSPAPPSCTTAHKHLPYVAYGDGREDEGNQVHPLLVRFCNSNTNCNVI